MIDFTFMCAVGGSLVFQIIAGVVYMIGFGLLMRWKMEHHLVMLTNKKNKCRYIWSFDDGTYIFSNQDRYQNLPAEWKSKPGGSSHTEEDAYFAFVLMFFFWWLYLIGVVLAELVIISVVVINKAILTTAGLFQKFLPKITIEEEKANEEV